MNDVLAGRRILAVEDEFLVLMLTEDMLSDLGCESVPAATVGQALAIIEDQTVDAAMLDMNLDGEKPYIVADALARRGIPYLFATGYSGHDVREGYADRPLLRKPFRSRELANALTRLFAP